MVRLEILNGKTEGDWEGEYTYTGARGSTLIDYIFVNTKVTERVLECKVEEKVDSNHLPISLKMETREEKRGNKKRQTGESKIRAVEENKKVCWDLEAKKKYREITEKIG